MSLKKGMKVKVCVGKDKGKSGEIIEINRVREFAKVKDVNMLKKHKKPTKQEISEIATDLGFRLKEEEVEIYSKLLLKLK